MTSKKDIATIKKLVTALVITLVGLLVAILICILLINENNTLVQKQNDIAERGAERFTVAGMKACDTITEQDWAKKSETMGALYMICNAEYRLMIDKSDEEIEKLFTKEVPVSLKSGDTIYTYIRDKLLK